MQQSALSPFSTRIIFILLTLVGIGLIPWISLTYLPSGNEATLSVSIAWPDASPEVIESACTRHVEGALSGLAQVTEVESITESGSASVTIKLEPDTDLAAVEAEAYALLRQVSKDWPQEVGFPFIAVNRPVANRLSSDLLMSYSFSGPATEEALEKLAESSLIPSLLTIEGLAEVRITGAGQKAWELTYNEDQLRIAGVNRSVFNRAISEWNLSQPLQMQTSLSMRNKQRDDPESLMDWPLFSQEGRLFRIRDFATIQYVSRRPTSIYRVGGKKAVRLRITAEALGNELRIAQEVRTQMHRLQRQLPSGYQLYLEYDRSASTAEELTSIGWRSLVSVLALLLFTWLVRRSVRYMTILITATLATLGITSICMYLWQIELHLYSLAALTISIGMILDNALVMLEHWRQTGNREVFPALIAATLTTLAAISIVFFLEPASQLSLADFASVLSITLSASLLVSGLLVPALYERPPFDSSSSAPSTTYRVGPYRAFILGALRFRRWILAAGILMFGLPLFLLPTEWPAAQDETAEDSLLAKIYNSSLGSSFYTLKIRPWLDVATGGVWRLFIEESYSAARFDLPEKTMLYIRASMPAGTTILQLDNMVKDVEAYLTTIPEVAHFETSISGPQSGRINITFTPEVQDGPFPMMLKQRLERSFLNTGNMSWSIFGVGQAFSVGPTGSGKNGTLYLYGYDYEKLISITQDLSKELANNRRVKDIEITSRPVYMRRLQEGIELIPTGSLEQFSTREFQELIGGISKYQLAGELLGNVILNGKRQPVYLLSENSRDRWEFQSKAIDLSSGNQIKPGTAFRSGLRQQQNSIVRRDQRYRVMLAYTFLGPYKLQEAFENEFVATHSPTLPLGYTISAGSSWQSATQSWEQLLGILVLMTLIWAICAAFFESVRIPWHLLYLIPLSLTGVLATFYLFDVPFNQGGYAAIILVGGLSVNGAIYLLHEYRRQTARLGSSGITPFIAAVNNRIVAIIATTLSTIIGLIPFLWVTRQGDEFWFSFGAGAIGGLVLSIPTILIFLPVLSLPKHSQV